MSLSLASGCLADPGGGARANMCESTDDCSGNKICDEGVCWGDPPDASGFAVLLIPPAGRPDLAPTEITRLSLGTTGEIEGLQFGETIKLHGRVILGCAEGQLEGCGESALVQAQVIVERAASFAGGPEYRRTRVTNVIAAAGEDSFSISLPRDGAEYRVTVVPDEASLNTLAAGVDDVIQAPPFSTIIRADEDIAVSWEIGKPEQLKAVEGCVTSATGNGSRFQGMHVTAFGRWTPLSRSTRASSVVTTDGEGCFSLAVPIDMLDEFDFVVKPAPGVTLPTLRLTGAYVRDPDPTAGTEAHKLEPLIMPNAANPVTFKLPLVGPSSGGSFEPVAGATVYLDTVFERPVVDERDIQVSYATQTVTQGLSEEEPGMAVVDLYPGSIDTNRTYRVRVVPPTDSEYASVSDATIEVGVGDGAPVLGSLQLTRRVAVRGTLENAFSEPLANTPLTVRLAPHLRQELSDPFERSILDNLRFPSGLSGSGGDFLLWLDHEILGLMAQYDLEVAPPDFSSAPRWSFDNLEVPSDRPLGNLDIGELRLPAAAYVRGRVLDAEGQPVAGAEARWFRLPGEDYCERAGLDDNCQPPARLVGIWESDSTGEAIAVLPDI